MKRVRLLPIVIFAAVALLLFKGIGILTNGGYVLVGSQAVLAEGHAPTAESTDPTAEVTAADGAITVPDEPTMDDTNPTLDDTAPVMGGGEPAGGGHGETAETAPGEHGAETPDAGHGAQEPVAEPGAETPAGEHGAAPVQVAEAEVPGTNDTEAGAHVEPTATNCLPGTTTGAAPSAQATPAGGTNCTPNGDAVPMQTDAHGNATPLANADGTPETENTILTRLSERRTELETLSDELTMRQALVSAAEQQLAERTNVLQQLEAQISALVDEKKTMEDEQFKSLVSMYEQMKPAEAAAILNALDIKVLVRAAKVMNPRKMSAILAKMDPSVAQALTLTIATAEPDPQAQIPTQDLSALPQIVGQ